MPWMASLKVSPVCVRIALLRSNASISVPSEPTSRPMRSKTWRFGWIDACTVSMPPMTWPVPSRSARGPAVQSVAGCAPVLVDPVVVGLAKAGDVLMVGSARSRVAAPRLAIGMMASEQLARLDLEAERLLTAVADGTTPLPLQEATTTEGNKK